MASGGKRAGAGRKPGLTFSEMVSPAEKKKFVEFILDSYMGDMRLAQWMGDHLFVKPQQKVDVTTNGKELPVPIMHVLPNHSDTKDSGTK